MKVVRGDSVYEVLFKNLPDDDLAVFNDNHNVGTEAWYNAVYTCYFSRHAWSAIFRQLMTYDEFHASYVNRIVDNAQSVKPVVGSAV